MGLVPGVLRAGSGLGEAGAKAHPPSPPPRPWLPGSLLLGSGGEVGAVLGFACRAAANLRGCGLPQEEVPDSGGWGGVINLATLL